MDTADGVSVVLITFSTFVQCTWLETKIKDRSKDTAAAAFLDEPSGDLLGTDSHWASKYIAELRYSDDAWGVQGT